MLDSVAFHFRRDFEDMALRARLLTGLAQDLSDLAGRFDLAVRFDCPVVDDSLRSGATPGGSNEPSDDEVCG